MSVIDESRPGATKTDAIEGNVKIVHDFVLANRLWKEREIAEIVGNSKHRVVYMLREILGMRQCRLLGGAKLSYFHQHSTMPYHWSNIQKTYFSDGLKINKSQFFKKFFFYALNIYQIVLVIPTSCHKILHSWRFCI